MKRKRAKSTQTVKLTETEARFRFVGRTGPYCLHWAEKGDFIVYAITGKSI